MTHGSAKVLPASLLSFQALACYHKTTAAEPTAEPRSDYSFTLKVSVSIFAFLFILQPHENRETAVVYASLLGHVNIYSFQIVFHFFHQFHVSETLLTKHISLSL